MSAGDDLEAGTVEHYRDARLYDFEYRRRRADVTFYRRLAGALGRPPGKALDVLELGCGTGRLLCALASDGHRPVGLDRSAEMLAVLRARLGRGALRHRRVAILRADLRRFALRRRFDLVIIAFNTLQHIYHRREVVGVLGLAREHLAPGGRVALDVMNPDLAWLSRDPERRWSRTTFKHPTTGERVVYTTNHLYDRVSQVNHIRIYYKPERGPEEVVRVAHRMFFPEELLPYAELAGLRLERRYGDFMGGPLEDASEQQVLVLRAKDRAPI